MKNNTKKTLKIYWEHIAKYKLGFFSIIFFISLTAILHAITPLYFKKFFDVLSSGESRDMIVSGLFDVLIIIGVLEFLNWIFWRIISLSSINFESKTISNILNTCFKYLHKHSFSFFNDSFAGSLVKRVNYFANSFEGLMDLLFFQIIGTVVTLFIILVILFTKNITLGLVTLFWLIFFLILNIILANLRYKHDVLTNEKESETTGFLADTISNNSNLKLFNGYKREVKGFEGLTEEVRRLRVYSWRLMEMSHAIQGFLMVCLEIGLFYISIRLWQKGIFTISDFVLIQSYVLIIFMKVFHFGHMVKQIYKNLAGAEEMTEIFNTLHEIEDIKNAKKLKASNGEIEFDNVNFCYNDTRKILNKLNLKIKAGERVALIGPSGAGKSTIIKVLLRNHDLTDGNILIDGQDIAKVTQESLWQSIGFVPQDSILFHRSLMDNIRYGKPDATDAEVIKASKLAHCHEFISSFPEKYDTKVGERGVKLSGGERQRVAIARAILKNAPILVLDEATSSLDSESEGLIQDALTKLMKEKTVIVIAHRLSTITKMDRIIVVDEGRIKEEGTHSELTQKEGGHYRRLWELQAGGFIK